MNELNEYTKSILHACYSVRKGIYLHTQEAFEIHTTWTRVLLFGKRDLQMDELVINERAGHEPSEPRRE